MDQNAYKDNYKSNNDLRRSVSRNIDALGDKKPSLTPIDIEFVPKKSNPDLLRQMQAQERTCSLGPARNTSSFLSKASSFVNPYIDERFRDKKSKVRGGSIGADGLRDPAAVLAQEKLATAQEPPNSFNIALNNMKERENAIDTI